MSRLTIRETTATGDILNTYIATPTPGITVRDQDSPEKSSKPGRIDIIPPVESTSDRPTSLPSTWTRKLLDPFLPVGYPDSVSPDYTAYQSKSTDPSLFTIIYLSPQPVQFIQTHLHTVYDSLQALFSTTASLLASRAVLETLGVGSSSATTTFAMYLSILQTTLSNLTSILFAHRFSTDIAQHVKFYRFFADIVNDTAFVLDVLSPSLPEWGRVPALCAASCCRALCGVTGGASKAVLSGHFAKGGNVGELAAKDGSQEVLVGLVGMWIGGFVVGRVDGVVLTWAVLMGLLAGHLWCTWMAVASVRLRTLGGARTARVLQAVMSEDVTSATVDEVGRHERILRGTSSGVNEIELLSAGGSMGCCHFGAFADLLRCAEWHSSASGRAYLGDMTWLEALFEVFEDENYLLWWHRSGGASRFVVVMKTGNDVACQLKAMCHAWRIARKLDQDDEQELMDRVRASLATTSADWPHLLSAFRAGGWNIEASQLTADPERRIEASKEAA